MTLDLGASLRAGLLRAPLRSGFFGRKSQKELNPAHPWRSLDSGYESLELSPMFIEQR